MPFASAVKQGDARVTGHRVFCTDLELSEPAQTLADLAGYKEVEILVRLHGEPLGTIRLPITGSVCRSVDIRRAALRDHSGSIIRHLIDDRLAAGMPAEGWSMLDLGRVAHSGPSRPLPTVTVAVCTRDRPEDLAICLESVAKLDPMPLEVLVIDNAPKTEATERLVGVRFPWARYVHEPRPGLDWARNRAILEARGEILAYTDDDCVADPNWVGALAGMFADDPGVTAVTGLVVPYELETEAQHLFERAGGFGRGYRRHWNAVDPERGLPWEYVGAGRFGTGANMAYRRSAFSQIGIFDPALDVGTVTNGGGDLDMFFRVLVEGHTLVYEPAAVIRHRHRRAYPELRRQIANNGYGFCSYLIRNVIGYPKEHWRFVYLASWWFWRWQVPRLVGALTRPTRLPLDLLALECWTGLSGLFRYGRARKKARQIASEQGFLELGSPTRRPWLKRRRGQAWVGPIGVRKVEVCQPLIGLEGVDAYEVVKVIVTADDRLIGSVTLPNQHRPVSARRLREAIGEALCVELLSYSREGAAGSPWSLAEAYLQEFFGALTIQYSESYANRSASGRDGDGFDLDQNVSSSYLQYNYSHGNDGAGFLDFGRPPSSTHANNTVRYNISENDARAGGGAIVVGGPVLNDVIYDNTVFVASSDGAAAAAVAISGAPSGVTLRNNIFFTGGGLPMITSPALTTASVLFQQNDYAPVFQAVWGSTLYAQLDSWRSATGQERIGSRSSGLVANPALASPGNGGTVGNPDQLASLRAYRLLPGSLMVNAGLDLRSAFGIDMGGHDFYGVRVPSGPTPDIGASERT